MRWNDVRVRGDQVTLGSAKWASPHRQAQVLPECRRLEEPALSLGMRLHPR